MEIQTAQKIDDALCFSPSERRLFNELCADHRGCVIDNVKEGKDIMFINDYSTVVEKELGFSQNPSVEYLSIDQVINSVSVDSKVNVRGVVVLDHVRTVRVQGEDVDIREGYLVDETSRIKLTLWREYCNLFENRSTYNLKNVSKMKYSGEIRLQTLHNTTYLLSDVQIEDYDEILVVEEQVLSNATISSVESSPLHCSECNKPLIPENKEDQLVNCLNCSKVMLHSSLKRKKVHFIIVGGEGLEKRKLSLHDEQLQLCFPEKDLNEMDEQQINLLLLTNKFNISYKEPMYVTRIDSV